MDARGELKEQAQRLSMLVRALSAKVVGTYPRAQRLLKRPKLDDRVRIFALRLVFLKHRDTLDRKLYLSWAAKYIAQECWLEGQRRGCKVDDVQIARMWNEQWGDVTKDWVLYCYLYLVNQNEDKCAAILRDSEIALPVKAAN